MSGNTESERSQMNGEKCKKRIVLLDDHSILRQGLKVIIDREPDLQVCGEAGDARTGLAIVEKTRPDLVLVDISLPGANGIEFIKNLRSRYPQVSAAVLTMHDESLYADRALRAGAFAFIRKSDAADELLNGIRTAIKRRFHLSHNFGENILFKVFGGSTKQEPPLATLSDRELEVFELVGRGFSRTAIEAELNVNPETLDAHEEQLRQKLGLASPSKLSGEATRWLEEMEENEKSTFGPRFDNTV